MKEGRDPLVLPLVGFSAGIAAAGPVRFQLEELAVSGLVLFILTCLAFRFAPRARSIAILAFAAICGASIAERQRPGPPPQLDAEAEEVLLISGCIVDTPTDLGGRKRFTVELEPGARVRLSWLPRDEESLPPLSYGQLVEVEARVRKPRNFSNPGSFDYISYLRRQDVHWTASARGADKLHSLPGGCGHPVQHAIHRARAAVLSRVDQVYPHDNYTAAMLQGMLFGDDSKIHKAWTEHFRRTGTYHALVISGLHITVVAGLFLFLLRVCGMRPGIVLPLAAALAWGYALLAGWQPPVVRSAAGFSLFVLGRFFFRRGRLLNLIAAVALVLLALDPASLYDPSFQLSFLSVAAIGGLAAPLIERSFGPYAAGLQALAVPAQDLHLPPRVAAWRIELRLLAETAELYLRLPQRFSLEFGSGAGRVFFWIAEMATVSAAVQIGLLLPTIFYFHRVSATSIPANLLVVPALTAAVPVGLLAVVTGWPPLVWITALTLSMSQRAVSWFSSLEPSWRIPDPPAPLAIGFALTLMAAVWLLRSHRVFLPAAAVGITTAGVLILHPFAAQIEGRRLELTSIDVGQGDSLFVAFPDGRTLLVDSGGIPTFDPRFVPRLDIGEDVVSPYLWARGFKTLDAIAVTHLHEDHAGGLVAAIENFRPRELWVGAAPSVPSWARIEKCARTFGVRIRWLREGHTENFGGASVSVLSPSRGHQAGASASNNDSLVLALAYGRHRFLLTGDAERPVERRWLDSGLVGPVDVLKVAHHGSRTSTTEEFVQAVRPRFAIISVGAYNSYGHPYPDVLQRLGAVNARILRTDIDGLITVRTDGKHLSVSTNSVEATFRTALSDGLF